MARAWAGLSVKRWVSGAGSRVKSGVRGCILARYNPEALTVRAGRRKPAVGGDETAWR